ncbi:MAG: maleylacetoacetate isomerase [Alphaproteobacteria bacterium]|jgi:maleylpyruvate isomerase|nr:maleylacetoacetate isomerase [Alphaproteobacteria bacterium]
MKLYDYWRSSAAFRMRIALNLKDLEYEREFIHLRRKDHISDAYLAVNPQGLVPALVDDDGTVLTQSMAMIEYLDETRPDGPRLIPMDAKGRARVRAISQAIACEIHPLNNLRVLRVLGSEFDIPEEDRNERWYKYWIAEGMQGLEGLLADGGSGLYAHGDTPTMADICLVPQVFNAERFGCDLSAYPTVLRVNANCIAETEFSSAFPDLQPDAE